MGENYAETKAKELRNPIWKDIFVSWKNFCNSVPIEKVERILLVKYGLILINPRTKSFHKRMAQKRHMKYYRFA